MGASEFFNFASKRPYPSSPEVTPEQAFERLVNEAQWEYGHGGYTGTIAEKDHFVAVQKQPVSYEEGKRIATEMFENDDPRMTKWGPALMIEVTSVEDKPGGYFFFGLASY